ncbi:MAG: TIGR00341 family protein [Bacteroidota bacterium]|nr:TIGR00341 family protein [Bacteroidota bacterium]
MLASEIRRILKYRFNLDEDAAEEQEIIDGIKKAVEFKGVNLWTLIFAIFIASIGLNINSTAVIIGAMLISPLMGPIMGIGLGSAIYDIDLVKKSFKNLLFAIIIALITSSLYFLISPLNEAKSELLARTNPTIWDVLIALFGGLSGIIAGSRKNISNAIPGVAIATALMPPLCTAGYGVATGNVSYIFGAFYLFIINCFFICLTTYWVIKLLKFKTVEIINEERKTKIKRIVFAVTFLLILPTVYFGYIMVNQELFVKNANEFVNKEIISDSLYVLTKRIDPVNKKIDLLIYGESLEEIEINRIINKRNNYNLTGAAINIMSARENKSMEQQNYSKLMEDVFYSNKLSLFQKDSMINQLKTERKKAERLKMDEKGLLNEFTVLFDEPARFSVSKTLIFDAQFKTVDTLVLLFVKPKAEKKELPIEKIEAWLATRTKTKKTKVVIE